MGFVPHFNSFCFTLQFFDLAKSKGIPVCMAHSTSAFTQRMYTKMGFDILAEIKYDEYKVNGEAIFDMGSDVHKGAKLFAKSVPGRS
jgi:hypothetical protein